MIDDCISYNIANFIIPAPSSSSLIPQHSWALLEWIFDFHLSFSYLMVNGSLDSLASRSIVLHKVLKRVTVCWTSVVSSVNCILRSLLLNEIAMIKNNHNSLLPPVCKAVMTTHPAPPSFHQLQEKGVEPHQYAPRPPTPRGCRPFTWKEKAPSAQDLSLDSVAGDVFRPTGWAAGRCWCCWIDSHQRQGFGKKLAKYSNYYTPCVLGMMHRWSHSSMKLKWSPRTRRYTALIRCIILMLCAQLQLLFFFAGEGADRCQGTRSARFFHGCEFEDPCLLTWCASVIFLHGHVQEVIAFQQDPSPEVRKFVITFMEDARWDQQRTICYLTH